MSQYIYAIIPYESGLRFAPDAEEKYEYCPSIPELKSIDSEFAEPSGLYLFADFVRIIFDIYLAFLLFFLFFLLTYFLYLEYFFFYL